MGKRAKLVAQVSRSLTNSVRNKAEPSVAIVINHVHGIMGGRGHTTAGGETLKYLSAIRIMIWPAETFPVSENDTKPLGFYVNGKIEKLRYGGRAGSSVIISSLNTAYILEHLLCLIASSLVWLSAVRW